MLFEMENYSKDDLNELCHGTFAVFRPKLKIFLTFNRAGYIPLIYI